MTQGQSINSVESFIAKWSASGAAERANKDSFLNELCDVLAVSRPNPTQGNVEKNTYVFERDALLPHEGDEAEDDALTGPKSPWPKRLAEQVSSVRDLLQGSVGGWNAAHVATAFKNAKRGDVEPVLESLVALGVLVSYEASGERRWKAVRGGDDLVTRPPR